MHITQIKPACQLAKSIVQQAYKCLTQKLSIIPVDCKTKKPLIPWKTYQLRLPRKDEIISWQREKKWQGIALVCGQVSGNIEVLDFDCKGVKFRDWCEIVEAEEPGLVKKLVVQKTQSDGFHVIYRCSQTEGNRKLCYLRIPVPDKKPGETCKYLGKDYPVKIEGNRPIITPCAIETRGQGGYILIAPTPGYQLIQNSFSNIPEITPEERRMLIQSALVITEYVEIKDSSEAKRFISNPDLPGSVFNSQGTEVVRELLREHGWVPVRTVGDRELWRRPGKNSGHSASLLQGTIFYNFSSNASPFEAGRAYSLFAVYAILKHNGNFKSAAKDLAEQGFGELPENKKRNKKDTKAQLLRKILDSCELFKDDYGLTHTKVNINNHIEIFPVKSEQFKQWLMGTFYKMTREGVSRSSLDDAISLAEGRAMAEGKTRKVFLRLGYHEDKIYLDLCNQKREIIEISKQGWRIISDSPILFRRSVGMAPLPYPEKGGDLDLLRPFINVQNEADWHLIKAWLITAFMPDIPQGILYLCGGEGASKSTTGNLLRNLIDPNLISSVGLPRNRFNDKDLFISAYNNWVIFFDNISYIDDYTSDILCRFATGAGVRFRKLYTDLDEIVFTIKRPQIMTGISNAIAKNDLLSRTFIVTLNPIPDTQRKTEEEIYNEYEKIRPKVLGALLDHVVTYLNHKGKIRLKKRPRLADVCERAITAFADTPNEAKKILHAFFLSKEKNINEVIEGDIFTKILMDILEEKRQTTTEWRTTQTELKNLMKNRLKECYPDEAERIMKDKYLWPCHVRSVSTKLDRTQSLLTSLGIMFRKEMPSHKGVINYIFSFENFLSADNLPKNTDSLNFLSVAQLIDFIDSTDNSDNSDKNYSFFEKEKEEKKEIEKKEKAKDIKKSSVLSAFIRADENRQKKQEVIVADKITDNLRRKSNFSPLAEELDKEIVLNGKLSLDEAKQLWPHISEWQPVPNVCPKCGGHEFWVGNAGFWQCLKCEPPAVQKAVRGRFNGKLELCTISGAKYELNPESFSFVLPKKETLSQKKEHE